MAEVVLGVDVEALVVSYLTTALGARASRVSTKVGNPRPDKSVRVSRTGGPRVNSVTDSATVLVECWADSETGACELARWAHAYLWALPQTSVGGSWVRSASELGGVQNFPDPDSDSPRYQFVMSLDVRPQEV